MKDGVKARYKLEFTRDAVRLVRGGEKVSAIAWKLGVVGQWRSRKKWIASQQNK
jgi:hypothetical protein